MPESGDVDVLSPGHTLPERRRVGLKLNFSSLGLPCHSEDHVPKRCKLDLNNMSFSIKSALKSLPSPVSILPSPLSIQTVSPRELADKIKKSKPILVLDCRTFLSYNLNHIQGSVNINCGNRFTRKRIIQGKCSLVDLITSKEGKDLYKRRNYAEIVLYDDQTSDPNQLTSDHSVHLAISILLREGHDAVVLKGGMTDFNNQHSDLCQRAQDAMGHRPLYSPTTPVIESEMEAIERAVACRVLPFLFIGNERDAANYQRLNDLGINYVLNITSHIPLYFNKQGIKYKRLPASDSGQQNLMQYFEEAVEFIDEARQSGGKVLIHCQAGVSRSATITIAYILKHTRMTMIDTYKYVKGKRPIISPNFNFMGQLMEYERELNTGNSPRILQPKLHGIESSV